MGKEKEIPRVKVEIELTKQFLENLKRGMKYLQEKDGIELPLGEYIEIGISDLLRRNDELEKIITVLQAKNKYEKMKHRGNLRCT